MHSYSGCSRKALVAAGSKPKARNVLFSRFLLFKKVFIRTSVWPGWARLADACCVKFQRPFQTKPLLWNIPKSQLPNLISTRLPRDHAQHIF